MADPKKKGKKVPAAQVKKDLAEHKARQAQKATEKKRGLVRDANSPKLAGKKRKDYRKLTSKQNVTADGKRQYTGDAYVKKVKSVNKIKKAGAKKVGGMKAKAKAFKGKKAYGN